MTEDIRQTLLNLQQLAEIDSKLAGIKAQKKKFEDELAEKFKKVDSAKTDAAIKIKAHQEKNDQYRKEERYLRDEQSKLVDRRKALQGLQSYKLQQAAEREIEAAAKLLGAQEENLIGVLDQLEELQKFAKEAEDSLTGLESELTALESEVQEASKTFVEREEELKKERSEITESISKQSLSIYERIAERNPMNAVVALTDNTCTGCYLELGPQTTVEIGRANSIVRCRGCGRILFIAKSTEE